MNQPTEPVAAALRASRRRLTGDRNQCPACGECHYRWGRFDGPDGEERRVTEHWTDSGDHYWLDYDVNARRMTVRDTLGRESVREWDALHQVTRYEDALGQVSSFEWNDERQLLAMTDAQGGVWRWSYDDAGRLMSSTDPLGRVEQPNGIRCGRCRCRKSMRPATSGDTRTTNAATACWNSIR
ncbi:MULTISPECIES: hypothetical protein [unclassified Caballeronia]|uniref:RHS repeat domain-containing protein n=1 Tax=unclassified Caballeronia TaxID=2646786 RepID=UPI00285F7DB2|nr:MULTISPECIES: hypothetical protein [unclassified Caballeronia]MDR5739182.1 hypothetical protein [Caballeronia sp. LZ016]MDR5807670.1 hypothetical protein [Caballeronia sp. LZ019]